MSTANTTKVFLFGELRAVNALGESLGFSTRKTASLFAYLAIHTGKPVLRDSLVSMLWPGTSENSARNSLSVALSSIRKQLEPTPELEHEILSGDHRVVQVEGLDTDLAEFERNLKAAHRAENTPERSAAIEKALESYGGPLLQGLEDSWILLERIRFEQMYFQALCQLMDLARRPSEIHRALNYAARGLVWDPKRKDVNERVQRLKQAVNIQEETRYRKNRAEKGSDAAVEQLGSAMNEWIESAGEREPPSIQLEVPGGAVPLGSPFYVERSTDAEFIQAVLRWESIVLLKGPRHIGKTSLLARALNAARGAGAGVVLTDFRAFDSSFLEDAETLYSYLSDSFAEQLAELNGFRIPEPESVWDKRLGPGMNFERYLRKLLSDNPDRHIIWGLDEADRLFGASFSSDFFGLLRSWHNKRALEPTGPWNRMTLAITYATDAHLFIQDPNQSPFNVGVRLALHDFDIKEIADLNNRYGLPIKNVPELQRFLKIFGGHPYLSRAALNEMVDGDMPFSVFEPAAIATEGLFADYVARALQPARQEPELAAALQSLAEGGSCPSADVFYRLRSAGIVIGESSKEARVRCALFQTALTK